MREATIADQMAFAALPQDLQDTYRAAVMSEHDCYQALGAAEYDNNAEVERMIENAALWITEMKAKLGKGEGVSDEDLEGLRERL